MIYCGNGVLPQLRLRRNKRPKVAGDGPHVSVRQLVPRLGEGVRELLRILEESPRDLFVSRVNPQGEVRCQHGWCVMLGGIVRIGYRTGPGPFLWFPLVRTSGPLCCFLSTP